MASEKSTEGGPVTQVGEGQEAEEATPPVLTVGAPHVGEVLADRYELAEHINDDAAGRQVWQGVDVVLRRPVAVVLRYPGGDSAQEMLQAAVTASRVIHPNLAGVYDAIDEDTRAYVVREWIDGEALRELVVEEPLDAERATSIAHAVASAVAAVHATGMVHGNVHPGTVMVAADGRVVLADARATEGDTPDTDVRAIGGILYFALTGHWPHAEVGPSSLPDAVRDGSGAIAAPRMVRAGVPAYLDDLTMDLLDDRLALPSADVLAAELDRLDVAADEPFIVDAGPLRFSAVEGDLPEQPPANRRKLVIGVASLLVIATVGLLLGISVLADPGDDDAAPGPGVAATATDEPATGTPAPAAPKAVPLTRDQVRIVDPDGDRTELADAALMVDGKRDTAWESDTYRNLPFGGKSGMGVLIKFPEPTDVTSVQVNLSATGASASLFTGQGDTGSTPAGDRKIRTDYKTRIGEPIENHEATTLTFGGFPPDEKHQYLLIWFTKLPTTPEGRLRLEIQEITVQARA
ncbi:protein kinase family protein [Asanoa sp. WMMD1127]|uniref:protein kinase family protein n=1 Tax=Asanoa sp. WMMD1127 TaxID=3016107 RepID=UPI002417D538|nr:protein kinase family protein [Asanoa sp. WMMD1127]MDG4822155.1 protein kinase family protein [Asanoa sp. WMMD1127]